MLKHSSHYLLLLLAVLVLGFSACDDDDDQPNNPFVGTITDQVEADPNFSVLAGALERTGVADALDVPSANITVFAPTDAAFDAAGIDLAGLSDEVLANILRYHVISGNVQAAEIADGDSEVESLNTVGIGGSGLPLFVNNSGGTISLGGAVSNSATVTTADIEAVNGTIHIIDDVLIPPTIVDRAARLGNFNTLLGAATRAGLADVLSGEGTFTLFAPTDEAFTAAGIDPGTIDEAALANVLRYHVLGTIVGSGDIAAGASYATTLNTTGPDDSPLSMIINNTDAVVINGDATVGPVDISGSNGVIHAIDNILTPQTLVDLVTKNSGLDSLTAALTAADLVSALSADGPFTVFAPSNAGFTAAADTLGTLTAAQVSTVLQYHAIGGSNVRSDALPDSVATLSGFNLNFGMMPRDSTMMDQDMSVFVQNNDVDSLRQFVPFQVVDAQGTNGVLHIIENILLPVSN